METSDQERFGGSEATRRESWRVVPFVLAPSLLCAFVAGCTQQVDTGRPPVVIAMADVLSPSRPSAKPADDTPATPLPTAPDPLDEVPFDPATLLAKKPPHDECVAQLLPSATEDRWLEIDWRTDLLRARREANREGKPMFMWLMDGNPLGCT